MAEKKRVHIEEPEREVASDETTLVDSGGGKNAAAATKPTNGKLQREKKGWRRIFSVFSRNGGTVP
jgi:hypothetical protein